MTGQRVLLALALALALPGAARAQAPGSPASVVSATLPASADLRPWLEERGLGPRRQGHRNTCSVLTMTGAMEAAASRLLGRPARLSPEYLNWATNQVIGNRTADRGQFFHDLWRGYEAHGLCEEAAMPYRPAGFDPAYAPDAAAREAAKAVAGRLRLVWIRRHDGTAGITDAQLQATLVALADGHPVCAGSGHSLLLVGFALGPEHPGGGQLTLHDSGSGRVGRMTFEEARRRLCDVCWVEARP